ncbi:MAG: hypothetical protein HKN84_03845 [Gammaproteobacteria bacterium]|nr:hypothetical protein [Gammaproteobacteria bacterium]
MGYLFVQMLASLFVATVIGFAAAWLIRRTLAQREMSWLSLRLSEANRSREQAETALQDKRNEMAVLKRQLRRADNRSARRVSDITSAEESLQGKVVYLQRAMKESHGSAEETADWERRYHRLETKYAKAEDRVSALRKKIERLKQPTERVAPLRAVADRPGMAQETAESVDDLKRVSGIGPIFERTLNEMGICRFEQLARLSEQDVERVAAGLETFPYRIVRDRWVEQARDLAGLT